MSWAPLLIVVLLAQFVLATLVWYDAHQRSLEHGFRYWYGIMVPLAGLLVFVAYLIRRDEEPRRERTRPAVDQPEVGVAGRVQLPDPFGLPRRLVLAIFALWRRFWRFSLVASIGLFAGALVVDPVLNAWVLELSGFLLLMVFWAASTVRDVAFAVDLEEGELRQEYAGGLVLSGRTQERVVQLQSIDRVRAVPVGRHSVCRLAYERPFFSSEFVSGPLAVIVESEQTADVLDAFDRAGVDTDVAGRRGALGWLATALVPIGLLPVAGTLATGTVGVRTLGLFVVLVVAWLLLQAVTRIRHFVAGRPA